MSTKNTNKQRSGKGTKLGCEAQPSAAANALHNDMDAAGWITP